MKSAESGFGQRDAPGVEAEQDFELQFLRKGFGAGVLFHMPCVRREVLLHPLVSPWQSPQAADDPAAAHDKVAREIV